MGLGTKFTPPPPYRRFNDIHRNAHKQLNIEWGHSQNECLSQSPSLYTQIGWNVLLNTCTHTKRHLLNIHRQKDVFLNFDKQQDILLSANKMKHIILLNTHQRQDFHEHSQTGHFVEHSQRGHYVNTHKQNILSKIHKYYFFWEHSKREHFVERSQTGHSVEHSQTKGCAATPPTPHLDDHPNRFVL